ncbi:uncharacterized protein Dwil_GK19242 [Drosophila willistoni]|uniref:Uncharacterized protein n=1 Tax=Drosophila willistoni TaxID=7260 RepID=B4N1S2_DROWI|nr:uncharacterized protein LOC6644833 [Drosophila willistoni]EDW78311.1 uncharacterized protein Dwil_GK19242 [Drosophila willistoni]
MARLTALGIAVLLHSVMGVSYYFLLGKCSPAPMLGCWLFSACIVTVLQAIHIFPDWWYTNYSATLFELTTETLVCCLTLDLMLTKLWCRIEGLCHCAIVGILQPLITEDDTYAAWEYWLLGLTTSVIGACLLWFTLWATALPAKMWHGFVVWRQRITSLIDGKLSQLVFAQRESTRSYHCSRQSEVTLAG